MKDEEEAHIYVEYNKSQSREKKGFKAESRKKHMQVILFYLPNLAGIPDLIFQLYEDVPASTVFLNYPNTCHCIHI
jgi:hypothetical protein